MGRDDAVGLGAAGYVLGGDITGGHPLNQVDVDKGQLSGLLDPPDQLSDVQNGPIEQEHHGAAGAQSPVQTLVVLDGGDDRSVLHSFYKEIQLYLHKRPPSPADRPPQQFCGSLSSIRIQISGKSNM